MLVNKAIQQLYFLTVEYKNADYDSDLGDATLKCTKLKEYRVYPYLFSDIVYLEKQKYIKLG